MKNFVLFCLFIDYTYQYVSLITQSFFILFDLSTFLLLSDTRKNMYRGTAALVKKEDIAPSEEWIMKSIDTELTK